MLVLLGVLFGFVVAVAVMAAGVITMIVGIGMIARAIGAIVDFFHGDDEEEVEVVEGEATSCDVVEEDDEESEDEDEESEDEEVVVEGEEEK